MFCCNFRYGSPDDIKEYNVTRAYRLAMETWAKWINSNINPNSQKIFFTTMSPTHLWYVCNTYKPILDINNYIILSFSFSGTGNGRVEVTGIASTSHTP